MEEQLVGVDIPGKPTGQGSMTLWRAPDGSERAKHPPATVEHRNLMVGLLRQEWGPREPYFGPVSLHAAFYMPRPAAHFGTGRNAEQLKPSAPAFPVTLGRNDLDKMIRLVGDALVIAGVLKDDAQIVRIMSWKLWHEGRGNGSTTVGVRGMRS